MPYRDPKPQETETVEFEAVWNVIKNWDIGLPEDCGPEGTQLYAHGTGNHVMAILDALNESKCLINNPIGTWEQVGRHMQELAAQLSNQSVDFPKVGHLFDNLLMILIDAVNVEKPKQPLNLITATFDRLVQQVSGSRA